MPINWRLAAPEVRYILEHSEARALVCDESLVAARRRGDEGPGGAARCGRASPRPAPDGWTALADLRVDAADLAPRRHGAATTSTA